MKLKNILLILISFIGFVSCNDDDDTPPNKNEIVVLTKNISKVELTTAQLNGSVEFDGSEIVTERGFYWSTHPGVNSGNNRILVGEGLGNYSTMLTNLSANTNYYVRAYAINSTRRKVGIGEEKSFTTLANDIMFSTNHKLHFQALHNYKDKIIYLFTFNVISGQGVLDYKMIAYDYIAKRVISEKEIDPFYRSGSLHSIGEYNNQRELYILSLNKVSILDPLSLSEIGNITLPNPNAIIMGAELVNNLIFISYFDSVDTGNYHLEVYSRETLEFISEATNFDVHSARIEVYEDMSNPNLIRCLSFESSSSGSFSGSFLRKDTFNANGEYVSNELVASEQDKSPIRSNSKSPFVMYGDHGRIYGKTENKDLGKYLNEMTDLQDYAISTDGGFVYSIQNDNTVLKYNTSDFGIIKTIPISVPGKVLLVDDNSLIILQYRDNFPEATDVFISFYPN